MQEKLVLKKSVKKLLWTIIFILVGMIITKQNPELKAKIEEAIYKKSIPMMNLKNKYNKFFSWKKEEEVQSVAAEKIQSKKEEKTDTGVKLTVKSQQPIPMLESGIIILMDNHTIIVEQIDGVTATYQNIEIKNYKLYDYLEKGEYLGEASSEEIFISFSKEGSYYDYKNYL
ncbi:MAG: hypothetical protein IKF71_00665 [Bacilli bacterium]|nr:hypothetical protein [Bacilli bacterium]